MKVLVYAKGKKHVFSSLSPFLHRTPFSFFPLPLTLIVCSVIWLWEQQQPDKRYIRARLNLKYPSSGFRNPLQTYIHTYNFKDKVFFHLLFSYFYTQNQVIADSARTELWTLWPPYVWSIHLRKASILFLVTFNGHKVKQQQLVKWEGDKQNCGQR